MSIKLPELIFIHFPLIFGSAIAPCLITDRQSQACTAAICTSLRMRGNRPRTLWGGVWGQKGGVKFGRLMGEGKQAPARHGINFALMIAIAIVTPPYPRSSLQPIFSNLKLSQS